MKNITQFINESLFGAWRKKDGPKTTKIEVPKEEKSKYWISVYTGKENDSKNFKLVKYFGPYENYDKAWDEACKHFGKNRLTPKDKKYSKWDVFGSENLCKELISWYDDMKHIKDFDDVKFNASHL